MMQPWRRPPWPAGCAITALALTIAALWACGDSEEAPEHAQAPRGHAGTGGLAEVRGLPNGDAAFAQRPRSCTTTRGVVIDAAGKPSPPVLNVPSGACVIWGNRGGRDVFVHTVQGHPEGGENTLSRQVSPGTAASTVYGPLERLTPARAAIDEQRRAEQRFCPYRTIGLGDPSTDAPVKHAYTISPGGARGTIVVAAPSRPPAARPQARSAELRALLRLRCGAVLLEERAAYCSETRAILIAGGKPRPRRLRLRSGRSVCVFWGNQDDSAARIADKPEPRPARRRGARPFREGIVCRDGFDIVDEGGRLESRPRGKRRCTREAGADGAPRDPGRSIPPRTAAHLSSFRFSRGAAPQGNLSYTIRPSGATATVAFE